MRELSLAILPDEEWKNLPERPDYKVSSLGRIYGPHGLINPSDNGRGYLRFSVVLEGKKKSYHVHQVVCLLFHGEPPEGKPNALHNNHIKHDCRVSNLHWGSQQDNVDERGEAQHTHTILDWDKVHEIRRRVALGESHASLGRAFNIVPQYVKKLVDQKTWPEKNYART